MYFFLIGFLWNFNTVTYWVNLQFFLTMCMAKQMITSSSLQLIQRYKL